LIEQAAGRIRAEVLSKLGKKEVRILRIEDSAGKIVGQTEEKTHPAVEELIRLMNLREHVYCFGPAGSGKTYAAEQAAKLLGFRSAVFPCAGAPASRLMGMTDATGRHVLTAFHDLWRNGGVAVLDEFDRMLPSAAAALNSLLANGVWIIEEKATPAHPDFLVVANGNTDLRGATAAHLAAQALDTATMSRFAFVAWPYDEEHESAIVLAVNPAMTPVLEWLRALRSTLAVDRVENVVAGPREALKIARYLTLSGATIRRAVDVYVWRGYPAEDVARYERALPLPRVR
jgi:MoxR-like ATPase